MYLYETKAVYSKMEVLKNRSGFFVGKTVKLDDRTKQQVAMSKHYAKKSDAETALPFVCKA